VNADLSVPGSLIAKNTELMKIADRTNAFIDFEVYEQYAGTLAVGGKLTATIGTSTVAAEITQIGKVASLSSDGLSATVSVRTKPLEAKNLTPGATAVATISLGEKQGVLLLPRGAWLTTGGQKYVYKVAGNKAIKTTITCGEIQGTQVEILKGLSEGDSVITSGYQDFIANDEVALK
jgi:multidrug efflux pump subunit AcrA (membrane-fusion protein)